MKELLWRTLPYALDLKFGLRQWSNIRRRRLLQDALPVQLLKPAECYSLSYYKHNLMKETV